MKPYGRPHAEESEIKTFRIFGDNLINHYGTSGWKDIDFLLARHEEKGPQELYREDGSVLEGFGAPHYNIKDVVILSSENFMLATDEKPGSTTYFYFGKDGLKFNTKDEIHYTIGFREKLDPYGLYSEMVSAFGLYSALVFRPIEGKGLLARAMNDIDMTNVSDKLNETIDTIIERNPSPKKELADFLSTLQRVLREKPEEFMESLRWAA